MNTPTPETDTFQNAFNEDANTEQNFITLQHYCDLTDFARKLERERDEARAERDQLRQEVGKAYQEGYGDRPLRRSNWNNSRAKQVAEGKL